MLLPGNIEQTDKYFKAYNISFRHLIIWTIIIFLILIILFSIVSALIFNVKLPFPYYLLIPAAILGFVFAKRSLSLVILNDEVNIAERLGIFKDESTIRLSNIKNVKLIEDPAPKAPFGLWAIIWPAQSVMLQLLWKRFDVVGVFTKSGKLKKFGLHLTLKQTQKLTEYIQNLSIATIK